MHDTKQKIIESTRKIVAQESFEGFNVRKLAAVSGLSPSHLYYYAKDTRNLFKTVLDATAHELGEKRALLLQPATAREMLSQRIRFQFDNADAVVYILKYYSTFRSSFKKNLKGYAPQTAYLHILEVLHFASDTGEWSCEDVDRDAKVIAHAINGFVMEYYPHIPSGSEKERLINEIHEFLMRALVH